MTKPLMTHAARVIMLLVVLLSVWASQAAWSSESAPSTPAQVMDGPLEVDFLDENGNQVRDSAGNVVYIRLDPKGRDYATLLSDDPSAKRAFRRFLAPPPSDPRMKSREQLEREGVRIPE